MGRVRVPGNALAIVALMVAVAGGSAYAGVQLGKNDVKSKHIAPNAVTNKHTRNLTVSALRNVPADEPLATAPQITLLRRGPIRVVARCAETATLAAWGLVELKVSERVVGRINGNGAELEEGTHELDSAAIGQDSSGVDSAFDEFFVISRRASMDAKVRIFAKAGNLPGGNNPYGAGDRCIFQASETGTG